jgi:hypothetical protein
MFIFYNLTTTLSRFRHNASIGSSGRNRLPVPHRCASSRPDLKEERVVLSKPTLLSDVIVVTAATISQFLALYK